MVSIDGDEALHDQHRGKGCYQRTLKNLQKCLDIGECNIGVSSVMTREEFEGEPGNAVRDFCREKGIRKLTMQAPLPLGRGAESPFDGKNFFSWVRGQHAVLPSDMKLRFNCGLGHNLYVEPDGTAYPCYAWCEPDQKLGDLSEKSVQDILNRGELLHYMNTGVDTNEKCSKCEVRYLCGGLCKAVVKDKKNINSGDFECSVSKRSILNAVNQDIR